MFGDVLALVVAKSSVYSGADQRKRQSSASLAFIRGIQQWTVTGGSPNKGSGSNAENVSISWCRHQMETFSTLLTLYAGIHRSSVNSPHKRQWRGALMFSLIWAWINGWVNNRDAGDLRRHRAHYDVIVILMTASWFQCEERIKTTNAYYCLLTKEDLRARNRYRGQGQVITPTLSVGVIICPCHWYLFLAHKSTNSLYINGELIVG